jgi:hypothetical protein
MPLGVRGCPLRRLISRCLPHQLELIVSIAIGRSRATGAIDVQSLDLCCAARAASTAVAASTSTLTAASSAITVLNCFPHVSYLELYPHHRDPLDVVGLVEGRPPAAGTDIPDNGLNLMVTMVHVRGGRVAPPVKAMISIDPAVGASVPVWAAVAVGGTAAARALTRSAAGANAPVWAVATAPVGCAAAHCAACSRAASLVSLSSLSLSPSAETKLPVLLAHRVSISAAVARAVSVFVAASTSVLAAASSAITSLTAIATVAAVSAAARSRSSAAAISASYRCCALEAIER